MEIKQVVQYQCPRCKTMYDSQAAAKACESVCSVEECEHSSESFTFEAFLEDNSSITIERFCKKCNKVNCLVTLDLTESGIEYLFNKFQKDASWRTDILKLKK